MKTLRFLLVAVIVFSSTGEGVLVSFSPMKTHSDSVISQACSQEALLLSMICSLQSISGHFSKIRKLLSSSTRPISVTASLGVLEISGTLLYALYQPVPTLSFSPSYVVGFFSLGVVVLIGLKWFKPAYQELSRSKKLFNQKRAEKKKDHLEADLIAARKKVFLLGLPMVLSALLSIVSFVYPYLESKTTFPIQNQPTVTQTTPSSNALKVPVLNPEDVRKQLLQMLKDINYFKAEIESMPFSKNNGLTKEELIEATRTFENILLTGEINLSAEAGAFFGINPITKDVIVNPLFFSGFIKDGKNLFLHEFVHATAKQKKRFEEVDVLIRETIVPGIAPFLTQDPAAINQFVQTRGHTPTVFEGVLYGLWDRKLLDSNPVLKMSFKEMIKMYWGIEVEAHYFSTYALYLEAQSHNMSLAQWLEERLHTAPDEQTRDFLKQMNDSLRHASEFSPDGITSSFEEEIFINHLNPVNNFYYFARPLIRNGFDKRFTSDSVKRLKNDKTYRETFFKWARSEGLLNRKSNIIIEKLSSSNPTPMSEERLSWMGLILFSFPSIKKRSRSLRMRHFAYAA